MISFLAPAALGGLALLALPIILHIFKPKKVREIPFSSLRWLRASQHRLSRRIQWHQILLFLCRFLLLLFLILALAKPILSSGGDNKLSDNFVVIDISRSMKLQSTTRDQPIETAKKAAEEVLAQSMPGDRTSVILTGTTSTALGPLAKDNSAFIARIRDIKAGLTDTDLTSALAMIKPMLSDAPKDRVAKIYFLTDNHINSWSQAQITNFQKDLAVPSEIHVIEVGALSPFNAWIADARLVETKDKRSIRVRTSVTGRATFEATIIIRNIPGVPDLTKKVNLQQGLISEIEIDLPLDRAADLRGKIATISLEPGDGMPEDDVYWLNLDSRSGVKVLVIEPAGSQLPSQQSGFHLRTALSALAAGTGNKTEIILRTPEAVTNEDLYKADVVFMVDVPRLPDATLTTLEAKVRAGYGLGIFLGEKIDTSFYNTKMFDPLKPSESLLPSVLGNKVIVNAYATGQERLTNIQWSHPILAPLYDPVYGDLAYTGITRYFSLDYKPETSLGRPLALIGEKSPAIIERSLGSGRVILFNTTANDLWSSLPKKKSFLPMMDRTINYLAGGLIKRTFEVGELITIPLADFKEGTKVAVISPTGKEVPAKLRSFGGRTVLLIDQVSELGVYKVQMPDLKEKEPIAFVVQAGRGDSNLEVNKSDQLRAWWAPDKLMIMRADEQGKLPALVDRALLWPWFIGAACLMMLLEMFLVHKLCPKMNPGITQSAIADHGFFRKPVTSKENAGPGQDKNRGM
jgi:hypothetical protein